MLRFIVVLLGAGVLNGAISVVTQGAVQPALSLHAVESPSFPATCGDIDANEMTCSDLDVEADGASYQSIFVLASHADALAFVQFAIRYSEDVDLVSWTSCTGGLSIYESGWPASGTAAALAFDPVYPTGQDSLVVIGFFTVGPNSTGYLKLSIDERIGEAQWVDASAQTHTFGSTALGRVEINTRLDGYMACGTEGGEGMNAALGGFVDGDDPYGPMWIRVFEGFHTPIAVEVATTSSVSNPDLSGIAVAYMASDTQYLLQRVKITGVPLTPLTFGSLADVDATRNREAQLVMRRSDGDEETEAQQGWGFTVASGEHPDDSDGGYAPMMACTAIEGDEEWFGGPSFNPSDRNTLGAVVLNGNENNAFVSGRFFNSLPLPPNTNPYKRICREQALSGVSGGCGNFYSSGIGEVLDSEFATTSSGDVTYIVGTLGDGFRLTQADTPPVETSSSIDENWTIDFDDPTADEAEIALAADSDGNAVIAIRYDAEVSSETKSHISIQKRSASDGGVIWQLAWSVAGANAFEVMDIAVDRTDARDDIYVAGRFSDPALPTSGTAPGLIKFPSTPSDESDYEWFYHFPNDGEVEGVARAVDVDDLGDCVYVTGESDNPDDATTELQMFVAGLDADTGDPSYGNFIDPTRLPTTVAAIGAAGYSVGVATDEYQFAPDDVSYVYVLGRAYHASGGPTTFLARYHTGGCSTVDVAEQGTMEVGTPWSVRGGRSLEVKLPKPARRAFAIRVFDVAGRLVAERSVSPGMTDVRVADLTSGVYFVHADIEASVRAAARAVIVR